MAKTPPASAAPRRVPALAPNAWTTRLARRRAAGGEVLDLAEMNPTRLGLLDEDALAEILRQSASDPGVTRYEPDPRGLLVAREAVAAYYRGRGAAAQPSEILLTTGTSESYAHLFRLLADPDETILIPSPSYPLFEPIASVAGLRTRSYALAHDGAWHLDAASLRAAFHEAATPVRAVVLVQPNHPTGSCLDAAERSLLEVLCVKHGAALISDEVFADFPWPGRPPIPSLLGDRTVPTFVLGGLSKACGLPQLKLGWIAACGPPEPVRDLLAALEWIADLFLSVATPVQLAALGLLELRHGFQARVASRLEENLATLRSLTQGSEAGVLETHGGWAAILTLPARRTGEEWALALLDQGVAVHPDHFYDLGRTSVVVSLIVEPKTFRSGIDRLVASLGSP
jgi:alanine-synthesizing transaminase